MKITALTCHCDRPEAWALCEDSMRKQTRQPDTWLVIDSSPNPIKPTLPCDYHHQPNLVSMRDKVRWAALMGLITGDAVVFFENDDVLKPGWLAWCADKMERGYQLAGEGRMVYHNVAHRWFMECENRQHAALGATCMSTALLEQLVNVIDTHETQFFDRRLWHLGVNKYLHIPKSLTDRHVVGIKGMPGTPGYSSEHRDMPEWGVHDPGLHRLAAYIGEEHAKVYAQYQLPGLGAPMWPKCTMEAAPPIAEELPYAPAKPGPLVAVVQYWDGDEEEARRLIQFLNLKFPLDQLQVVPWMSHGAAYPKGPNDAAMEVIRRAPELWPNASAVLLMEPDCVPVSPNWIYKLMASWARARGAGKLVMGSWRPMCSVVGHINGNMLFDPMLAHLVDLPQVPDELPWDTFLAEVLHPHAARTGLIRNLWKERWVPRERLTTPECGKTCVPVLIHGLRCESAWDLARSNFPNTP